MIHVMLTTQSGDQQEINLPIAVEDVLKKPMPYYLVYGRAEITFETSNQQLNESLRQCIPDSIEGGMQELSLLAHLLGRMNDQRLELLNENLPDTPCDCGELIRRSSYFGTCDLTSEGIPDAATVPLERYEFTWERAHLEERLRREFERKLENLRLTGGQLFEKAFERARENGDLARFDSICEYVLPEDAQKGKLCSYEFDLLPVVNFGGSEGIYVDCGLQGKFDESGRDHLRIGTMKTLSTDLDACKTMGELCGILMYHESQFVYENLYLFDSTASIERLLTQKLETAPLHGMTATTNEMQMT